MINNILDIQNLSIGYENNIIIDGLNVSFQKGNSYCIVGKNGAGKSTFLKSIIGLLKPYNGNVLFEERDITNTSIQERVSLGISYLGQNNNIFPRLKVYEHFNLVKDKDENVIEEYIPEILRFKNNYAGTLSGGEQRLLGLALTLLQRNKKIILLDELFGGVDNHMTSIMLDVFDSLKKKENITLLMVEQDEKIIEQFNGTIINF
jgi:ABC-type branched-subunit amino acid transport system ATPase component